MEDQNSRQLFGNFLRSPWHLCKPRISDTTDWYIWCELHGRSFEAIVFSRLPCYPLCLQSCKFFSKPGTMYPVFLIRPADSSFGPEVVFISVGAGCKSSHLVSSLIPGFLHQPILRASKSQRMCKRILKRFNHSYFETFIL